METGKRRILLLKKRKRTWRCRTARERTWGKHSSRGWAPRTRHRAPTTRLRHHPPRFQPESWRWAPQSNPFPSTYRGTGPTRATDGRKRASHRRSQRGRRLRWPRRSRWRGIVGRGVARGGGRKGSGGGSRGRGEEEKGRWSGHRTCNCGRRERSSGGGAATREPSWHFGQEDSGSGV